MQVHRILTQDSSNTFHVHMYYTVVVADNSTQVLILYISLLIEQLY